MSYDDDMRDAHYIGDGAYVKTDEYGVELLTSNGLEKTNSVYLDPYVLLEFVRFLKRHPRFAEILASVP